MEQSKFGSQKILTGILVGLLAVIILGGVFWLGMSVGSHRSHFACQWGERYGRMLGMPMFEQGRRDLPPAPMGMPDPNGASGSVVSNNGKELLIKGRDGVEKSVLVTDQTHIRRGRDTIKISDITANEQAVIFGSPTSTGQLEAKFIRVVGQEFGR